MKQTVTGPMREIASYSAPIGEIILAADADGLCGLWFRGQKYFPKWMEERIGTEKASTILNDAKGWLDAYFAGDAPELAALPLHPSGTAFQREVWELLKMIPYGETTTYGALAAVLAARRGIPHFSAQAVGGAIGHNPLSIIVPCHRVVGADGSLTGYAGGTERKAWLLQHEKTAFLTAQRKL